MLEASLDGETYHATRLGRAHLDGGDWIMTPIAGSATLMPAMVRIELTGPEAAAWNGEYEPFAVVQQREIAALAGSRARSDEPAPAAPGQCRRYRDCVCALSDALAGGNNPYDEVCRDAERLLRTAPDNPSACGLGLVTHSAIASELGLTLPDACAESAR